MNIDEQKDFLETLLKLDQGPREQLSKAVTEEERQAVIKVMIEQDEKNLAQFLDYIEQNDWPSLSIHGEAASAAAWLIIQHSSVELIERFLPVLKDRAEAGEASKKHAAMMEDRLLMWREEPQIYGSQATGAPEKGIYIWPVKNPDIVNELRTNMDFKNTIEEYAEDMKAVYNPNLKVADILRIL